MVSPWGVLMSVKSCGFSREFWVKCYTNLSVALRCHLCLAHTHDPEILELLHMRQRLCQPSERANSLSPVKNLASDLNRDLSFSRALGKLQWLTHVEPLSHSAAQRSVLTEANRKAWLQQKRAIALFHRNQTHLVVTGLRAFSVHFNFLQQSKHRCKTPESRHLHSHLNHIM